MLTLSLQCNTVDCPSQLDGGELVLIFGQQPRNFERARDRLVERACALGWYRDSHGDRCPACVALDEISRLDRATAMGL